MGTEDLSNVDRITSLWGKAQSAGITRRKFLTLLAAGGAAAVLAACTKSTATSLPTPSTTAKPTTSTTTKPATSTTVSPTTTANKYGGILKIAWPTQVGKFGYPPNLVGPAGTFASPCEEGLLMRSTNFGVYTPLLAESWDLAPDKSSYTFHLRKGVKFHDGTDFNAAAVKWNLDHKIGAPGNIMKSVESFTVVDDYTLRANLKSWTVLTLDDFADGTCYIYSPTAFQKNGEAWADAHPIGTGPFIFTEWQQNQWYKYVKNPNYWDKKLPYLDGMEWDIMVNATTTVFALQKGDIDVINQADVDATLQMLPLGFKEEHMMAGHYILTFDSTSSSSIWSDKRLREALEYGIDKETIASAMGKGFDKPIYEIIFGAHGVGNPETTPRKYDPVKARQLLAEAGYASGLKLRLSTNQLFSTPPYIVALQENLAKIGIAVELNVMPAVAWNEYIIKTPQNNELLYNRQQGSDGQPLPQLNLQLPSTSVYFPGVKRPDGWDAMLDNLLKEPDPGKQVTLLNNMEKVAYNNAMFVPLFGLAGLQLFNSKLKSDMPQIFFLPSGINWLITKYAYFAK